MKGRKRCFFKIWGNYRIEILKSKGGVFKGFCLISYKLSEEAMRAFAELDNKVVFGRILHIRPAF